jgi:excinuclease ABC subunit B
VSATPGPYELARTEGEIAEQVIRPTGLLDPIIEVKPAQGQVPDLITQCEQRVALGERVLVTALTKRLCEDLTSYLDQKGLRVRYLHSEVETLERVAILTDLRLGEFDVLVGVNLLREGLDLPEVSLVCILDADKEGFLRSGTSLIQQMGRAARNVNALVIMYADKMTPAMQAAIGETERRRTKQIAYNTLHGITPETIKKEIRRGLETTLKGRKQARDAVREREADYEIAELLVTIREEMVEAARKLDFEAAAILRDQLKSLEQRLEKATKSGGSTRIRRSELSEQAEAKSRKRPGMPGVKITRAMRKKGSS